MKYKGLKYIDLLRLREETFKYFTIEDSLKAVKKYGWDLRFVKYQTPEICLEAVRQSGYALRHVINQTEQICIEAYKRTPASIDLIRIDIKDEELRKAKENNYRYFTLEDSLKAVRENGYNLSYVKYQTNEICLEAVRRYGISLQYVWNQTEEICLEAYKYNPDTIIYIRDSLEEYRRRKLNLIRNVI